MSLLHTSSESVLCYMYNVHVLKMYILHLYLLHVYVHIQVHVNISVHVLVFVGSYLATKVFIGNLPATGRGWVIMKLANEERRSTTNKSVT